MKVAIIGGGAMGEAIIAALLRASLAQAAEIQVEDIARTRLDYLQSTYGVSPANGHVEAVRDADYVILAVKPQDFEKAAAQIGKSMAQKATALSIMAGVPIARIVSLLDCPRVCRAMPNTPAQIGEGMTVWTATPDVGAQQREGAAAIFGALGKAAYVAEERYLDMVTALSGSGPAYVFLFIEALIDAGVHVGLSRDLATTAALQTVLGSARYMQQTGKHPAELRNQVTSPAGTTAAGLRELEMGGLRAAVLGAVIAAYERSRELGGESK